MAEQRKRVGRSWFEGRLHWLYFWLDLYGPDGRPSHTKVLSAWGFFFALTVESVMGLKMAFKGSTPDMAFTTLVLGTLAIPMGKGVFARVLGSTSETTYTERPGVTTVEQVVAKGTSAAPAPPIEEK